MWWEIIKAWINLDMQEDKEKEMTKDVVVSLKGLQLAPDQQSDAVEVIAPENNI